MEIPIRSVAYVLFFLGGGALCGSLDCSLLPFFLLGSRQDPGMAPNLKP